MFPLSSRGIYTLGINFHWVPVPMRKKFLDFLIKNSQRLRNPRAFSRFTYNSLKRIPALKDVAEKGVRLYINQNAFNVQEIPREDVERIGPRTILGKHRARKVFKN